MPRTAHPLKFGILGAANIAPLALINPAQSHPDVFVYAVAARSRAKAEAFAKKHRIPVVYGSYQGACSLCVFPTTEYQLFCAELLDNPEIDVVYNPVRIAPARPC